MKQMLPGRRRSKHLEPAIERRRSAPADAVARVCLVQLRLVAGRQTIGSQSGHSSAGRRAHPECKVFAVTCLGPVTIRLFTISATQTPFGGHFFLSSQTTGRLSGVANSHRPTSLHSLRSARTALSTLLNRPADLMADKGPAALLRPTAALFPSVLEASSGLSVKQCPAWPESCAR